MCKASKIQSAFKNHEHFKDFISQIKTENLSAPKGAKDYLATLAESEEAANQLIDRNIGEILSTSGESLIDMHITDQQVYNKQ